MNDFLETRPAASSTIASIDDSGGNGRVVITTTAAHTLKIVNAATAGSDYTAVATTVLTFAANDATKTFPVTITSDTVYEVDETFTVTTGL